MKVSQIWWDEIDYTQYLVIGQVMRVTAEQIVKTEASIRVELVIPSKEGKLVELCVVFDEFVTLINQLHSCMENYKRRMN